MANRVYTVEFEAQAVTAQVDFFEIAPATNKPVCIHALYLAQSSDLADAAEEILRYRVIRGHATTGTGGSQAVTAQPVVPGDAAAGFTADTLNTTIASAGTAVNLHSGMFNIRVGEALILPPEMRWQSINGSLLVVRLMAAPTDSLTMSGTLYVEEV